MPRCVCELFSGNADITKAFNDAGITCISVDFDPEKGADLCEDCYALSDRFFMSFNFIWLSPDCTTYSLASHGKHRAKGGVPVSDYAKFCDAANAELVRRLCMLDIPFIMENPRGHLRNMDFMQDLHRCTVYYSVYGAPYSKPTDFFSNRDIVKYFDTSVLKTGIHLDYCAGRDDFLGRCKIPPALVKAIVKAAWNLMEEERRRW